MKCPYCGNEQPDAEFCGKCGANVGAKQDAWGDQSQNWQGQQNPYGQQYYQQSGNQYGGANLEQANKQAKNALIFAIVGLVCFGPLAIAAIILGFQAYKSLKAANAPTGNAVAGIVLGIVAIVSWIIGMIFYFAYLDYFMDMLDMCIKRII